ncbi:hypothetical protein ACIBCR_01435 [Micromonospora echinospora]|uniref:hypothetical protein n=1 Tax=Micromonospora echinospora TaxID=1877 RepID=UPI0037921C5B
MLNGRVIGKRAATLGAVAAFGLAAWAQPSFAASLDGPVGTYGVNASVLTSDSSPGGQGIFEHDGEILRACDIEADGLRAVAYLRVNGATLSVHDSDGANGQCAYANLSIAENTTVELRVCLRNGPSGADQSCSVWRQGVA